MKKLLLLATFVIIMIAMVDPAPAMAPLGTPTSDLKTGQFGVGVDYAYSETKIKIDDLGDRLKTNMLLANLGYGVTDEWKGFIRLGTGNASIEDFSGDYGFALGWGTKYTFLKYNKFDWGALFQMNWLWSEDKVLGETAKVKPYDIVIALGPNYHLDENISIYGGPLLQWVRGKVTFVGETGNIKEDKGKNFLGGFAGVQAAICQNTSLYGEIQFFGGGWAVGTGVAWKF